MLALIRDVFLLAALAFALWIWTYPEVGYHLYLDLTQAIYGEVDYD